MPWRSQGSPADGTQKKTKVEARRWPALPRGGAKAEGSLPKTGGRGEEERENKTMTDVKMNPNYPSFFVVNREAAGSGASSSPCPHPAASWAPPWPRRAPLDPEKRTRVQVSGLASVYRAGQGARRRHLVHTRPTRGVTLPLAASRSGPGYWLSEPPQCMLAVTPLAATAPRAEPLSATHRRIDDAAGKQRNQKEFPKMDSEITLPLPLSGPMRYCGRG